MKRIFNLRILVMAAFLLMGGLPVAAVERPFALNGRGVATFLTDGAGNIIGANVTASGTASHLGLWTLTGTVNFTPDPDNPGTIRSSASAPCIAADGDQLQLVLAGRLDTNTFTDHGTITFAGGTGRFQAASGTADFVVTVNPLTGAFEFTAVGSIEF